MIEVGEQFVFLEAQARAIAGSQLLSRSVGVKVGGRDVLVAIDAAGDKHLLIPLTVDVVDGDNASQGVTLGARMLRTGSGDVTYADLHCRISGLAVVFERLVEDVLDRLGVDDSAPIITCRKVLGEWRALLKAAGQDVTRETVIGLVGELEVLRLLAVHNPDGALDAWRGPTKSVHDFARDGAELEVKTTTSVDGNFIMISNWISSIRLPLIICIWWSCTLARTSAATGLDGRIDELIDLGVPRDGLLTRAAVPATSMGVGRRSRIGTRSDLYGRGLWHLVSGSAPSRTRRGPAQGCRARSATSSRWIAHPNGSPTELSSSSQRPGWDCWMRTNCGGHSTPSVNFSGKEVTVNTVLATYLRSWGLPVSGQPWEAAKLAMSRGGVCSRGRAIG